MSSSRSDYDKLFSAQIMLNEVIVSQGAKLPTLFHNFYLSYSRITVIFHGRPFLAKLDFKLIRQDESNVPEIYLTYK